ncbi:fibronectin type III domain-containing protein [Flammeovirga aprica]|uniref:T9SS type A sorting domain-containing protein n=1 Tax=Flammeovirga aprica JL-4 TaxID=694437 RepID=A0A7X9XBR6_9BACT|nr:fibronectin type III domain-containing protein [Flammeovirga aprica]NME70889.1 T9SS type A sorting domain-containing protein [Flammeovirga aprica JL-4]
MKRLTLLFFTTLVVLGAYAQNCPPSHPYEACGRCWESASQAQSGGCNETNEPDNPPAAPSNLVSASVTTTSVSIQWNDNSSDEEGFEIYRNNSLVATVGANVTSYTSQNLSSSTTYSFEVLAYNGSLKSSKSNTLQVTTEEEQSTAPAAPSNLVSTSVTTTSVGLQWNDNSSDEEGFEIYRNNSLVATVGANVTSYNNQNLSSNTTYTFEVLAYSGSLKSSRSNALQATTEKDDIPVDELGNVSLSSRDEGNGWVVEWNSVTNATAYSLNITTKDGNTTLSNDNIVVTGLSYSENNPTEDITYVYTLTASNATATKQSNPVQKIRSSCNGGTADEQGKVSGKFTPKNGKILMFLGQDNNSIDEYVNTGQFPAIGGFTNYTNIYDFAGLENINNYGSGDMCIQCGIDKYPSAAVAIGLYMVEDNDGKGEDHPNGLTDVVNGVYDASIDKFANFAKANPTTPFFLRIGYEFDGTWNFYDPTKYINAYRYLVDRLNAQGVENVAYVWQSAAYGFTYNSNPIDAWYPGDEYVDYIGLSFFFYDEGFNGPNLQFLLDMARNKQKPVMMAEVSAQYYDFDENTFTTYDNPGLKTPMTGEAMWNQYFEDQLKPFIEGNEDVIRAISYINADWQSQEQWMWPDAGNGYWGDTRVQQNPYIAQQWNSWITSGQFQNGDANLYQILTTGDCGTTTPPPVEGVLPGIPQNIAASSNSSSSINVSWSSASDAESYVVKYSVASGNYTDSVTTTSTQTTINNLEAETNYYVNVYAINAEGSGDLGTETSATTQAVPVQGDKIEGKFTPKNGKTMLAIGQDLAAMSGYREGNMPEPAAAVAYVSFFMLTQDNYGINYGATGMDNDGNFTDVDTDWGSGPLNASSTALGWDQSALIMAMSITENWNLNGLQGIANGQYEQHIDKLALFCNTFPDKKIYLRIGYEFDGRWNSQETAGGNYPAGYHKQEEYKAAWRHIVDGMNARGVNNVAYVWQSSTSPVDDVLDGYFGYDGNLAAAREDISGWYPGDEYVDWCGISWFISPTEASNYFGFDDVPNLPNQDDLADEMLAFAREHNKPVMIAEATPQGYDLEISEYDPTPSMISRAATGYTYEGAKTLFTEGLSAAEEQFAPGTWFGNYDAQEAWDRWFTPFLDYIHANDDVIRSVTYINANWNTQAKWASPYAEGYWGDTRIEANPAIKALWLEETNSDFWLLGSPSISSELFDDASNAREVSLKEELENIEVVLYPNPVHHTLRIKGMKEVPTMQLYSSQGVLMKEQKGYSIDVSQMTSGLYILKINNELMKKVIIE